MATFGVAGNFTRHLEQAGEAKDFENVKTKEANAPKAVFPTYIPSKNNLIPEYLKTFPFDSEKIFFPEKDENLQIEPALSGNYDKIIGLRVLELNRYNFCNLYVRRHK